MTPAQRARLALLRPALVPPARKHVVCLCDGESEAQFREICARMIAEKRAQQHDTFYAYRWRVPDALPPR